MKQRTWELQEQDEAVVASLQQGLGVSPVIARLLCNRGLTTVQKAKDFLNKSIDSLYDPLLIPDMDKAVARIEQAVAAGEKITIFGDYDVDGITLNMMSLGGIAMGVGMIVVFLLQVGELLLGLLHPALRHVELPLLGFQLVLQPAPLAPGHNAQPCHYGCHRNDEGKGQQMFFL